MLPHRNRPVTNRYTGTKNLFQRHLRLTPFSHRFLCFFTPYYHENPMHYDPLLTWLVRHGAAQALLSFPRIFLSKCQSNKK